MRQHRRPQNQLPQHVSAVPYWYCRIDYRRFYRLFLVSIPADGLETPRDSKVENVRLTFNLVAATTLPVAQVLSWISALLKVVIGSKGLNLHTEMDWS